MSNILIIYTYLQVPGISVWIKCSTFASRNEKHITSSSSQYEDNDCGHLTSAVDQTAQQTLTWFKRFVAGISPRRPWTEPCSFHVEFMVGN
jgi:hypothetical protein